MAGVGEIVKWERLSSGRYNILVKERPGCASRPSIRATPCIGSPSGAGSPMSSLAKTCRRPRARIRATCRRLLVLLKRSPDLLDGTLANDQLPGVVADRVAAAVIPDASLARQRLLETLDVGHRLALWAMRWTRW